MISRMYGARLLEKTVSTLYTVKAAGLTTKQLNPFFFSIPCFWQNIRKKERYLCSCCSNIQNEDSFLFYNASMVNLKEEDTVYLHVFEIL